jgi:hypothetical protein
MESKISIDRVVDAFLTLAGQEALSSGRILCSTAAETLGSWLDRSKQIGECEASLNYAAACMAYYRYVLKSTDDTRSIKAGDITVNDDSDKMVSFAKNLMDDALHSVEHLFKPKRFAFVKTEVC